MRFLIDMTLSPQLALRLREQGHDAIHASEAGLHRASDIQITAQARQESRIIVTADLDFPRILALTYAEGPALILFRGGNYSEFETQQLLDRVLSSVDEDQLATSVTVIDRTRIRRTRLPLRLHPPDESDEAQ